MKTNQLKAGVILSYLNMFLGIAISILYTPIMLRLLGQSEYGLYNIANSFVGYLGLLSFGFGYSYVRYYSKYKINNDDKSIAKLNGMFTLVFAVMGIIALILGSSVLLLNTERIFSSNLTIHEIKTAKILMSILIINISITFLFTIFNNYINANEKFIFSKIVLLIKTIANPIIVLPLLILGYGSVGLVLGITFLNLVVEVSLAIYCFTNLKIKFDFKSLNFRLLKEIAVFSSFIFINILVDQLNWSVDKVILGIYKGTASVALYGVASQINTYYMSFSSSISSVFIPRINLLVSSTSPDKVISDMFVKIGRIQYMVLLLILSGFIIFGKPFIYYWAGKDYSQSYYIVLLLIIPATISYIQNIGIAIQRAKNLHKFASMLYILIAIANVAISIPLGKRYAAIGCAIGTGLTLLIGNMVMNWYYKKMIKIDIKNYWIQIYKISISVLLPILLAYYLTTIINIYHIWYFIIFVISYIIIYCLCLWIFAMNKYEKQLINNILIKMRLVSPG